MWNEVSGPLKKKKNIHILTGPSLPLLCSCTHQSILLVLFRSLMRESRISVMATWQRCMAGVSAWAHSTTCVNKRRGGGGWKGQRLIHTLQHRQLFPDGP